MIIAFYPGAGGNRYLQYLLGKEWTQHNRSYDNNNQGQQYQYRYLNNTVPQPAIDYTLTHCMNSQKIFESLPVAPTVFIKSNLQASLRREWMLHGHQRYLDKNIKPTTLRVEHYNAIKDPSWPNITSQEDLAQLPEYIQKEVNNDYKTIINHCPVPGTLKVLTQNLIDKINSAYETINWHQQYYQQYPVDFSVAQQIIDIDTDNDEFAVLMRKELSLYSSEIFDQVWNAINE